MNLGFLDDERFLFESLHRTNSGHSARLLLGLFALTCLRQRRSSRPSLIAGNSVLACACGRAERATHLLRSPQLIVRCDSKFEQPDKSNRF